MKQLKRLIVLPTVADGLRPVLRHWFRLFQQLKSGRDEMAMVDEVARIITATLDIDEVYEKFALEMKKIVGFDLISINVVDHEAGMLVRKYDFGQPMPAPFRSDIWPLQGSHTQHVIETGQTLVRANIAAHRRFTGDQDFLEAGLNSSIKTPLISKGRAIGTIGLYSKGTGAFGKRAQRVLERSANQIASAVENALSYEASQRAECENAVMAEIGRIISSSLDIDEVYKRFSAEVGKLLPFDRIVIRLFDENQSHTNMSYLDGIEVADHESREAIPVAGRTQIEEVLRTREPSLVQLDEEAELEKYPGLVPTIKAGLRSFLIVPLFSNDKIIGVLLIRSLKPHAYAQRHVDLLVQVGNQIAGAIANAQLFTERTMLANENLAIAEIGQVISSSLDIHEVYEGFVGKVKELVSFDWITVNLLDSEGSSLTATHLFGPYIPDRRSGTVVPLPGTFTEGVIHLASGIIAQGDVIEIVEQYPGLVPFLQAGVKSFLGVPLINRSQMLGALIIVSSKPNNYSQRDVELMLRVGDQISGAISNAQMYEKTRQAEEAERRRSQELATLLEVASILSQPGTFDQKVGLVMEQLCQIAEADQVVFRVPESGGLRLVGAVGSEPRLPTLLPYDGSIPALAVSQRQTIVIDDYPSHPLASAHYLSRGIESVLATPVISRGSVLGVVTVGSLQTDHFTPDRVNLLTAIVNGLGPLLETAQLEDERNRTEERMQETAHLASIGELAAGVAHEINNPLTSVLGYSDIVLRSKLPKKYREDLQTIYDQAKRAAKIVQNLVFFARRSGTDKQYLDVNSILGRALEMKSYDFKVNNIQVTTRLSAETRKTMADEHQLVQVILNLLTNAEQAIYKARGKGRIDVRTASLGSSIEITIKDDGPGIPQEHLQKIFEPFFTTKGIGQGTGLGLSISYGIVKSHGGEIWVESVEEQGATFHITLPVVLPEVITIPQIPRPARNGGSTKHLLVVDDEPDIRDLLKKYLELERYTVDLAVDGNEAWRKLRTMSYDCILLDLKMPQMSGPELYELLRDFSPSLANKVVFITGDTANPASLDFISETGNFFITKPFRLEDLLERVNDLWEGQPMDDARGDVQVISLTS